MKWTKLSAEGERGLDPSPYHVLVCLLDPGAPEIAQSAEIVCRELAARGLQVLFDDRELAPDAKTISASQLGMPAQINVSGRRLEGGEVELVVRSEVAPRIVPLENVAEVTLEAVRELKRR